MGCVVVVSGSAGADILTPSKYLSKQSIKHEAQYYILSLRSVLIHKWKKQEMKFAMVGHFSNDFHNTLYSLPDKWQKGISFDRLLYRVCIILEDLRSILVKQPKTMIQRLIEKKKDLGIEVIFRCGSLYAEELVVA